MLYIIYIVFYLQKRRKVTTEEIKNKRRKSYPTDDAKKQMRSVA